MLLIFYCNIAQHASSNLPCRSQHYVNVNQYIHTCIHVCADGLHFEIIWHEMGLSSFGPESVPATSCSNA